ncbi:MAG TPA: YkvA family protein [Alcanivoracaceae bacterium]|nr:YkvA family protein [Alcanivoracaceae bacterium]
MAKLSQLLRQRFLRFRREVVVLWYAFRHPSTPLHLKIGSLALAIYLLSPFDLIPIVVPVFGLLDDLIIVPFGVSQIVQRLPHEVHEQASQKADKWIGRYVKRPLLYVGLAVAALISFWVLVVVLIVRFLA